MESRGEFKRVSPTMPALASVSSAASAYPCRHHVLGAEPRNEAGASQHRRRAARAGPTRINVPPCLASCRRSAIQRIDAGRVKRNQQRKVEHDHAWRVCPHISRRVADRFHLRDSAEKQRAEQAICLDAAAASAGARATGSMRVI